MNLGTNTSARPRGRRTPRRTIHALLAVVVLGGLLALFSSPAQADRLGTMAYANGTFVQTLTQTSGDVTTGASAPQVKATYTGSGATAPDANGSGGTTPPSFPQKSASSSMFSPSITTGTTLAGFTTNATGCATVENTGDEPQDYDITVFFMRDEKPVNHARTTVAAPADATVPWVVEKAFGTDDELTCNLVAVG